jgi:hypothetical protein
MKLPIRTLGLAAAALLIGSALAPASAQQQQSGVDGQVALRSDGALYLITSGQRRWISSVAATDEEINALQEGEPIYAGLAPQGSTQASAAPTKPSTGSTASKTASKTTKPSTSGDDDDDDDGDDAELSEDIPITVDVDGDVNKIKRDSTFAVEITTGRNAICDLRVQIPGDDDIVEDSKNPDSRGRCRYTVDVPSDAKSGSGKVIGSAREGGKMNRQEIPIRIVK